MENKSNNTYQSFQFRLEAVLVEGESKNFISVAKKILLPHSTMKFEVSSSELNSQLKNSANVKFIILELAEAIDENDNSTTSISQAMFTNLLKMGK